MKNSIRILSKALLSCLAALALVLVSAPIDLHAADPLIVISMGDSYASGEGIEPFYGQDKPRKDKVNDEDWLAHRSQQSWPGLLTFKEINGTLKDYKAQSNAENSRCRWYFTAVSGAVTNNLYHEQTKTYDIQLIPQRFGGLRSLPPQLNAITDNNLKGKVDYVTVSLGGNDVDFAEIIKTAVTKNNFIEFHSHREVQNKINAVWEKYNSSIGNNIENAYKNIGETAGVQAKILVTGYPKLLDENSGGVILRQDERHIINTNVHRFNEKLRSLVSKRQSIGENIHFIDIEEEFDKDGGHLAYSQNPWINPIMTYQHQDLSFAPVSAYSIHPNSQGAKAYARCVNRKIRELEESEKGKGIVSGQVCKASDLTTPIPGATVTVFKDGNIAATHQSDADGKYSFSLPSGDYLVQISSEGYMDFKGYTTVIENTNNYMETFLLISGSSTDVGSAGGIVTNSITNKGVPHVKIKIKPYWNNVNKTPDVLKEIETDDAGNYHVDMPLGNYTAVLSKDGYAESHFNFIVQKDSTYEQNGVITPLTTDRDYRITLTWGRNPRDLDSHIRGYGANGSSYHVYFRDKIAREVGNVICELDYDDRNGYGPEHITLNPVSGKPYYYYVYLYAGSGHLNTSAAKVIVEYKNEVIAQYNVPTTETENRYWNVFAIKNGRLIPSNTITSEPNLSYAN